MSVEITPRPESNRVAVGSMELLGCPFCGIPTSRFYVRQTGYGVGPRRWQIRCSEMECFVMGPERDTVDQAVEAWNSRKPNAASESHRHD